MTRFNVGDAVFANTFDLGVGALAEYATTPEHAAALKSESLDFEVFVLAGAGGVGTFFIQLAKLLGTKVVKTIGTANVEFEEQPGDYDVADGGMLGFDCISPSKSFLRDTFRTGEAGCCRRND